MKWDKYTIETTTEAEDYISCTLADLGIEGIEIEDNVPLSESDTSKMFIDILPELPPDQGIGYVSFYLEAGEDHSEKLKEVAEALEEMRSYVNIGSGKITSSETEDIDWMNNWKEFFHSFTIDDILIKPTWEELDQADQDKILIEIDPGISFGTGKHETTQLCIHQLRKYMKDGDEVLDVGCGSGILSIVSLKLGAGHLTGTDIDEDCITSTYENFEVNHLSREQGDFYVGNLIDDTGLQEKVGTEKYDVVVANILADVIIPMAPVTPDDVKGMGQKELKHLLKERAAKAYEAKEAEFPEPEHIRELERVVLLKVIDAKWMDHIDDMDQLRQSISLQAYAQKDPVVEYRYAGIQMFDEMIAAISKDIVMIMLHIRKKPEVERKQEVKVTGTNKDDSGPKKPVQRKNKKVQPNDPCPCGKCYPDGRPIKYKNCCGRNQ
mgnify:CR=1 FL=1